MPVRGTRALGGQEECHCCENEGMCHRDSSFGKNGSEDYHVVGGETTSLAGRSPAGCTLKEFSPQRHEAAPSHELVCCRLCATLCSCLSGDISFQLLVVWHLWKVSIDRGEPLQLTGYIASRPSVSPDGKMIACVGRNESKHQILILPVEGGRPLKRIDYSGDSLSGTRIEWTPDGKAVIYTIRPSRPAAIVRQSLDGGPPIESASFDQDELFDFGYSIDGRFLAVTRGGWHHDIVLISDLNR